MYTVSRDFHLCYAHRLLEHCGKCARLHGHNATVRVTLRGKTLGGSGMVVDFGDLKRTVGEWLENELDHRTLLAEADPLVETLRQCGEPIVVFPANPTAENLARIIFEKVKYLGFPVEQVVFWETEKCNATYSG